jgi:hypothetical protein
MFIAMPMPIAEPNVSGRLENPPSAAAPNAVT